MAEVETKPFRWQEDCLSVSIKTVCEYVHAKHETKDITYSKTELTICESKQVKKVNIKSNSNYQSNIVTHHGFHGSGASVKSINFWKIPNDPRWVDVAGPPIRSRDMLVPIRRLESCGGANQKTGITSGCGTHKLVISICLACTDGICLCDTGMSVSRGALEKNSF